MNTALPLFLIGLIFGGGIGFTIAAANGITLDGHDHSDPAHHATAGKSDGAPAGTDATEPASPAGAAHHTGHAHGEVLVIAPSTDAPRLDLAANKDAVAGWNLHIKTANFAFSAENASGAHVQGEGHAHVYVNGNKLGRVYGEWVHLDKLPAGDVVIEVTLNANDHRPLAVGDEPLAARLILQN